MIIIISILGAVLYFLIGIFSGVIYIYVNKCKKMTLFYNGHQVSYYIAKKRLEDDFGLKVVVMGNTLKGIKYLD